ncbi:MAG: hypothetical protein NTZ07_02425 [Candidatus Woesebacteria bacterium]|nr:hypothetical protein [Candidatus Woesebacteria bacterium]
MKKWLEKLGFLIPTIAVLIVSAGAGWLVNKVWVNTVLSIVIGIVVLIHLGSSLSLIAIAKSEKRYKEHPSFNGTV